MRVCELHRERASETLVSKTDGREYDLCNECSVLLKEILSGKIEMEPEQEPEIKKRGRKRTA